MRHDEGRQGLAPRAQALHGHPEPRVGEREEAEVKDLDAQVAQREEDGEEDDDARGHEHAHDEGRDGAGEEEGGQGVEDDVDLEAQGGQPVVTAGRRELRCTPAPRLVGLGVLWRWLWFDRQGRKGW